ncbi:MAG: hypothetical protein E7597_06145 [Ruminococcaceae bacterium]|nr:hypothetical protein [Oscillospiraceae bacterium]
MFKKIKSFYLENMDLVNKFWLNQIAMSILGIMVCLPMVMLGNAGLIIASVFASAFFLCLLYDNAWDRGFKDSNKVSNKRLEFRPLHGAKVAVFAYAPSLFFLSLWALSVIFNVFGIEVFNSVGVIGKAVVELFCNGTYLGIAYVLLEYIEEPYSIFVVAMCFLPAIGAYGLGYRLGLADKQIKTFFGMKPALGEGAKKPTQRKSSH